MLKFIYSEKAKKFCEIFILLLSYAVPVKGKVEISQNFLAFSEYTNFKRAGKAPFSKALVRNFQHFDKSELKLLFQ